MSDLPTLREFIEGHLTPLSIETGSDDHGRCVICQEDFNDEPENMVRISDCGHIFHQHCIMNWIQSTSAQRDTCPSCRTVVYHYVPLTDEDIQELTRQDVEEDAEEDMGWQMFFDEEAAWDQYSLPSSPASEDDGDAGVGLTGSEVWVPQDEPEERATRERLMLEYEDTLMQRRLDQMRTFVNENFALLTEVTDVRSVALYPNRIDGDRHMVMVGRNGVHWIEGARGYVTAGTTAIFYE